MASLEMGTPASARRAINAAMPRLHTLERELRSAEDTLGREAAVLFERSPTRDLDELLPLHDRVREARARVEVARAGVAWLGGRRS